MGGRPTCKVGEPVADRQGLPLERHGLGNVASHTPEIGQRRQGFRLIRQVVDAPEDDEATLKNLLGLAELTEV